MTVKFYYQCTVKVHGHSQEVWVDGFVSSPTPEQCLSLAHENSKDQLVAAIQLADKMHFIDRGAIQSRMQIFNQVCENGCSQTRVRTVPCA